MSFFKSWLSKKGGPIKNYDEFWAWFRENERDFSNAVKNRGDVEQVFFRKLSPKLEELKTGFFYLTGLKGDKVELIFTADGVVKNVVFVEELVAAAPAIDGWLFTALKQPENIANMTIEMAGYKFSEDNLGFYANDIPGCPDEIDITIVYERYNEQDETLITNGIYIFLDSYLGELDAVTGIDNLSVMSKAQDAKEPIPIGKLKDYINWRQKEFIEKYEGVRHNTQQDKHSILEAELTDGNPLVAVVNTKLLAWENKASHPWILRVEITYGGSGANGMPDKDTLQQLQNIEDEIAAELKDFEGFLFVARQTANNSREVFYACKDFRKPSKVIHQLEKSMQLEVKYDIYKDKYWRTFDHFNVSSEA